MKPGDFYVGVLEFFAVLLPGSILLGYLVSQAWFAPVLTLFPLGAEVERYAGFLLAAYALGHMVFLLASPLDEIIYRPIRSTYWKDVDGDAFTRASQLRQRHVGGDGSKPMNTFKWSQAYLLQNVPAAAAEVRRYEADSKFFRSLTLLMAILSALLVFAGKEILALLTLVGGVLCCWRYVDQRYKSTDAAYRHVIVQCTDDPFTRKPDGETV